MRNKHILFSLLATIFITSPGITAASANEGFDYTDIVYSSDAFNHKVTIAVQTQKNYTASKSKTTQTSLLTAHTPHQATVYKKTAKLNGHQIESTVQMWQPRGPGFGGAFPRWTALVKRDGKTIYDAAFGHNHYLDIDIMKIVVDADSGKVNVDWVAEIDDSKHQSEIDAASTAVTDKTMEQLKAKL